MCNKYVQKLGTVTPLPNNYTTSPLCGHVTRVELIAKGLVWDP